jgi:PASTA domain
MIWEVPQIQTRGPPKQSLSSASEDSTEPFFPELQSYKQGKLMKALLMICKDPGIVLGQSPAAGSGVAPGSTVSITVNSGKTTNGSACAPD